MFHIGTMLVWETFITIIKIIHHRTSTSYQCALSTLYQCWLFWVEWTWIWCFYETNMRSIDFRIKSLFLLMLIISIVTMLNMDIVKTCNWHFTKNQHAQHWITIRIPTSNLCLLAIQKNVDIIHWNNMDLRYFFNVTFKFIWCCLSVFICMNQNYQHWTAIGISTSN